MAAYDMQKADIATRLARIEGQVRGIARMVDEDRYCIEILDQVWQLQKLCNRYRWVYYMIISNTALSTPFTLADHRLKKKLRKPLRLLPA